ncbi:competence protein ComEA [Marinobacter daqiaonensis]|uniref:Competence protein ComEA n=1 Tax=Marinobacter daqiaonensis TaxID=650891 RepID=A0A1I6HLP7_9GAMM|nr:ComEA family DNA-binding protein [Marinobacter daqiaonensis]SFR55356.1 competence protein ComEA [Marinobacter daqiaonensis]
MKKTRQFFTSLALILSLFPVTAQVWAEEPAQQEASVVNINTATAAELAVLDGIGESKALAIVADRNANGPFESEDDLTRVRGIGDATVESNRNRITTR